MTIWILAFLLMASLAGLGYRQGVIRVAFSFAGILLGALLALPLAPLVRHGLPLLGVKQPLLLWLIPPAIVFVAVLVAFKIVGLAVHNKVEVYYKYKAADLQRAWWERLSHRLGLCLSSLNGAAYLILISFVIYSASYWTVQLATSPKDPKWVRLLNEMGHDLQSTGMARVGWAIDRMPTNYYDAADVAGIVYHTPQFEPRLNRYPGLLSLAERPNFQALYNDPGFTAFWQSQPPIEEMLKNPAIEPILKNPELLKTIWAAVEPNLQDLGGFLTNGVSKKYDEEKILGRWDFDANGTINLLRRAKPNLSSKEILQFRNWVASSFVKTTFVGTPEPEQEALLKSLPHLRQAAGAAPSAESQTLAGRWKSAGSRYLLTFNSDGKTEEMAAEIKGGRLAINSQGLELAFIREE